MKTIPDNCHRAAVHTGDGWLLEVQNQNGETVEYITWPSDWPASVDEAFLTAAGFDVQ